MKAKTELKNIEPKNIFNVPENYFEELSNSIEENLRTNILKSKIPVKNIGFEMPIGYFDNLSDRILAKISETEKNKISLEALPKENIFKVPDNYFDGLEAATILESLNKENVFKVSDDYFVTLPKQILSKTSHKKEAKILKVNWWHNSRVMWSAAASVVLIIGMVWMFLPNIFQSKTELALNKVNEKEISAYLETQDLSLIEVEAIEIAKNTNKNTDNQLFEHLNVDNNDIIQHLETEDLEEI